MLMMMMNLLGCSLEAGQAVTGRAEGADLASGLGGGAMAWRLRAS
jgi:hypothetical protein